MISMTVIGEVWVFLYSQIFAIFIAVFVVHALLVLFASIYSYIIFLVIQYKQITIISLQPTLEFVHYYAYNSQY
jgi:hypothetical protein